MAKSKKEILKELQDIDWEFFTCKSQKQWQFLCSKQKALIKEWGNNEDEETIFIRKADNQEFVLFGGLDAFVKLFSTKDDSGKSDIIISRGYLYSRHFLIKEEK